VSTPQQPPASSAEALVPTIRLTQVLGVDDLRTPDPTEDYHEASRLYPGVADPYLHGAARLERSAEMRITASRSVRRHTHRPVLRLPQARLGAATLADAISERRSRHDFGERPLELAELAALLRSGYGTTARTGAAQTLRAAPSGGALYPLEIYAVCLRVRGAEAGVYHFDPLRHVLEDLGTCASTDEVASLTPYEELVVPSAVVIVMTAVFWRSRFKYGARAYRFTLIEAGHVAQNLLLAATALGLRALPVGGFYDRRVDELVGADGINEAALYLLPAGSAPG
jgi:SagB-type dehydrogenase family enzyme